MEKETIDAIQIVIKQMGRDIVDLEYRLSRLEKSQTKEAEDE